MKKLYHLFTALFLSTITATAAPATKFDCDDLGSLVDQGGVPEKTALWKLGKAPGYERTFTVAWDMYSIPDRIVIKYSMPSSLRLDGSRIIIKKYTISPQLHLSSLYCH